MASQYCARVLHTATAPCQDGRANCGTPYPQREVLEEGEHTCTVPLPGMLLAAEVCVRRHGSQQVICAKLHHQNTIRCICRRCGYMPEAAVQSAD